ncbi:MAG: 4Fe-4S binding protein [bacterium]|nr:4Fe-4S binding protein [bacterium]
MDYSIHFICTHAEAREIVKKQKKFWISDCGCRLQNKEGCSRSRIDVCLGFSDNATSSSSNLKKATRKQVEELFKEADKKFLITRPFRNDKNPDVIEGICFCCDDCCGYFRDQDEYCDPGKFTQETDKSKCTNCGECISVCYFAARSYNNQELIIYPDNCLGCGLCISVCPEACIKMVSR